jgi:hypothetical protein
MTRELPLTVAAVNMRHQAACRIDTARRAGRVPVWPPFDCTVLWTKRHPQIEQDDPYMQRATKHYPAGLPCPVCHGATAADFLVMQACT